MPTIQLSEPQLYNELLALYKDLIVPFTEIQRDMPLPTSPPRPENDAEHSFSLSMVAITIAERLKLNLDTGLIAKYALVHDLVEVYAGDISVRDTKNYHLKHIKEAEALQKLSSQYRKSAPWIAELIHDYEKRVDQESAFVYAVDKMMGSLVRLAGDGIDWTKAYPEADGSSYHSVVKKLRAKAAAFPAILPFFDYIHDHLDKQRARYHER